MENEIDYYYCFQHNLFLTKLFYQVNFDSVYFPGLHYSNKEILTSLRHWRLSLL